MNEPARQNSRWNRRCTKTTTATNIAEEKEEKCESKNARRGACCSSLKITSSFLRFHVYMFCCYCFLFLSSIEVSTSFMPSMKYLCSPLTLQWIFTSLFTPLLHCCWWISLAESCRYHFSCSRFHFHLKCKWLSPEWNHQCWKWKWFVFFFEIWNVNELTRNLMRLAARLNSVRFDLCSLNDRFDDSLSMYNIKQQSIIMDLPRSWPRIFIINR